MHYRISTNVINWNSGAAAACAAVGSTQSQPIIMFVSKLLLCFHFLFLILNS